MLGPESSPNCPYQSLRSWGRRHGSPKDLSFRMEPCSNIHKPHELLLGQAMHRHCFLCFVNQLCCLQRPRQSDTNKKDDLGFVACWKAFRPHSPRCLELYWPYSCDKAIWINWPLHVARCSCTKLGRFCKSSGNSLELHSDLLWVRVRSISWRSCATTMAIKLH